MRCGKIREYILEKGSLKNCG